MIYSMVNVVEIRHVVELLDRVGSRSIVDQALHSAGLSRRALGKHKGFLPYRLEMMLLEGAARSIGDRLLGATVATQFDYGAYNAYASYVLGAKDLHSALLRGQKAFPFIQPGSEIVLRESGSYTLLGRRCDNFQNVVGRRHVDIGTIFVLFRVVQHFLGPDWRPQTVFINADCSDTRNDIEDILSVPVLLEGEMPAIAIETDDLQTPNPTPVEAIQTITFTDLPVLMESAPPKTMQEIVRQALTLKLLHGEAVEEGVAEYLSIGLRTMQRALQTEGTSFREVKARCLETRALSLLSESHLDIESISRSLGYEEPKSFQRAFRKWTGLSPHAYRAVRAEQ